MQAQGKALKALKSSLPVIMYYLISRGAGTTWACGLTLTHPSLESVCNNTLCHSFRILGGPSPMGVQRLASA
eukprot:SAG31_NODE_1404_length_8479_cov_2.258760_4_plen_72_part_00